MYKYLKYSKSCCKLPGNISTNLHLQYLLLICNFTQIWRLQNEVVPIVYYPGCKSKILTLEFKWCFWIISSCFTIFCFLSEKSYLIRKVVVRTLVRWKAAVKGNSGLKLKFITKLCSWNSSLVWRNSAEWLHFTEWRKDCGKSVR